MEEVFEPSRVKEIRRLLAVDLTEEMPDLHDKAIMMATWVSLQWAQ
jgi:hypothetical protein